MPQASSQAIHRELVGDGIALEEVVTLCHSHRTICRASRYDAGGGQQKVLGLGRATKVLSVLIFACIPGHFHCLHVS